MASRATESRSGKNCLRPSRTIKTGDTSIRWTILDREAHIRSREASTTVVNTTVATKVVTEGALMRNGSRGQQLLTTRLPQWATRCPRV